jgi:hypothetical protein
MHCKAAQWRTKLDHQSVDVLPYVLAAQARDDFPPRRGATGQRGDERHDSQNSHFIVPRPCHPSATGGRDQEGTHHLAEALPIIFDWMKCQLDNC